MFCTLILGCELDKLLTLKFAGFPRLYTSISRNQGQIRLQILMKLRINLPKGAARRNCFYRVEAFLHSFFVEHLVASLLLKLPVTA